MPRRSAKSTSTRMAGARGRPSRPSRTCWRARSRTSTPSASSTILNSRPVQRGQAHCPGTVLDEDAAGALWTLRAAGVARSDEYRDRAEIRGAARPGTTSVWGGPVGHKVVVGYRPESDQELAERESDLEVGYEHMWVRFNKVRTVETWVNLPTIHAAPIEQPPGAHKTVTRCYVTQLMPAHVTKLTELVTAQKGAPAFVHPLARQPWVNDAAVNACVWCNQAFTLFTRRHHCRACGTDLPRRLRLPNRAGGSASVGAWSACALTGRRPTRVRYVLYRGDVVGLLA